MIYPISDPLHCLCFLLRRTMMHLRFVLVDDKEGEL
jgi:hypothetical protein